MEWSKIKNIIILILLAVNVFLLVQTAQQERQSRKYLEESQSGAVEVLSLIHISGPPRVKRIS